MRFDRNSRWSWYLCALGLICLIAVGLLFRPGTAFSQTAGAAARNQSSAKPAQTAQPDPWTNEQTVDPATLAKEIKGPASGRPVVVSVSPHALYLGGHIPGAVYEGPGFNAQAIAGLKRWAQHLPRSTNLVVYCGCCPLVHCPNLRPAFRALQSMGFTHLRALILPTNFYTDWYSKGYPTAKGN
jgi:hypothetical protein